MERKKQRRDEELLQKIILRVKELRHMHDHQSQEQLAEATELSIAQLESGKLFPESDDYFDYLQVLQYYPRRIFRTAQLPAERQINTSGVSAAGIRRDEPDKRQTNNRQTDNRKTDKQQARTGGNNRQRTTYKKKVPLLRNLFTYCNTAPYSVSSATARNSATSSSVEFMT